MSLITLARSNPKDLSKIILRRQNRNPNISDKREVIAVDTETDNGDIFLIAASDGNYLEYPEISFENIAKYLMRYDEGYWVFFYNLGYDAECILKLLPPEILGNYRKSRKLKFEYAGYVIEYRNKKQLTIRRGKHSVSCYDIAQYYDNKSLTTAYEENIKKPLDKEYLDTKKKRADLNLKYYLRHKKEVRQYCIQDCKLTQELAENWLEIFQQVFHFFPRNWISSGYIAEKVLIANNIDIPLFSDIPYETQELAWKCFYGGRFELTQRGYIGKCYLYDINSAYPHALTKLPDLLQGKWMYNLTKIHPESAVGFFHIAANIADNVKIAPFPFRTKDNKIIYPAGEFETYVTLEELKAVVGDNRIKYTIIDSYQFIPDKNCGYPFDGFIDKLYKKRLAYKKEGNPLEKAIKIVLNSIYGKTAQRANNVAGNLFNPVIAAFITGYTRAQLYKFMRTYDLEREIVAFATDSVASKKEIPGLDSDELGQMKLDKKADDVIFLSNGFYRFNGKWKSRGVGYDSERKVNIEHIDTKVSKDGQLYIGVKTTRITHIKGGILLGKLKDVGKIEQYEKKINLNSDKKRFWLAELTSLNDGKSCDSMPINASLVANIISNTTEWDEDVFEEYEHDSPFEGGDIDG